MSRPRRSVVAQPEADQDPNVDPDYLTLSAKQQRNIDRAFNRGIQILEARGRKRRKVQHSPVPMKDEQGGFVDDGEGGGFMVEDAGGEGGFVPDDEEGGFMVDDNDQGGGFMVDDDNQAGGGFLPDDQEDQTSSTNTGKRIPLHLLPSLLSSLGLPSDEDVLAVLKASASGWEEDGEDNSRRTGKRGAGAEGEEEGGAGVELKDFRAVCAALMGPDDGNGDGEEDEDEDEDDFEIPSEESELSSLSGSEYGEDNDNISGTTGKNKSGNKVKSRDFAETEDNESLPAPKRKGRKGKNLDIDSSGRIKLSSRQKELAMDIWEMLKPPSSTRKGEGYVLGRDEVKKWVRELGEMWTEEEITEMVSLFSTQHEARGLSFDDFGGVMLRAGLV
ncbi:hypothetical protein I204_02756 [Kwoniella mangroviensis CBS 8886]|nr:hypothetical protein I204_02756 [Kwoniella mangroviensis CBS 8886]